jgi:transposase
MTATTREPQFTAPASTLFLAFELGSTKWTLAFSTSPAQRSRVRTIPAGHLDQLWREMALANERFGLAADTRVQSCYEAGRDGFWLHRRLASEGVVNVVVDSSSIEVNRRARRAKTDRLDATSLVQLLMRWAGGERKVWSVVHVPTPEAEDQRQLTREIETVREDRKRVRNRIHALLATQGIRLALGAHIVDQLPRAQTGDGRSIPPALAARLAREWAQVQLLSQRLETLTATRAQQIEAGTDRVAVVARHLCRLRGLAEMSAALFSAEVFGTRTFDNRRQLGALLGLVPVPYRSDQRVEDQNISKAGRGELRRVAIQISWGWLRWQPESVLTRWFYERFGRAGGRARRIGIVAVARKLMIALWQFVVHGVVPAGATLKPVTT